MDNRTVIEVTLRKGAEWNTEISQKTWWPNAREWGADKEEDLQLEKMQLPTFSRRRRQDVSSSASPGAHQPRAPCRN